MVRLGEQMVSSSEGTRALALELCREFEDKFLLHLVGGEVSSFFLKHLMHHFYYNWKRD
jgi:dynamin GTPase